MINKLSILKFLLFICAFICQYTYAIQKVKAETDSIQIYVEKNNVIKAIEFARKKSLIYLKNKKYNEYCNVILENADLFEQFNDKENAIKILFKALPIAEKYNLNESQISIYRKLGDLNGQIFEFTKGKKYLKIAEKKALDFNNTELIIRVYRGLFKIHAASNSDSTFYFLKKIGYYSKNTKNKEIVYKNYSNFSQYYLSVNENKLAKKYLDSAYNLAIKIGDKKFISRSYGNLGYYYVTVEKNYEKAKNIFLEILKNFSEKNDPEITGNGYLNVAEAYKGLKDYKNAHIYLEKYIALQDDIVNGRINQANQELETKYAINKVESEFKNKEKQISSKQERNQKLLLVFAFLFILAGFIFYFYYQNLLLKQKNKIKDIDNKLHYKIINATLDGQDLERNKISAILHDQVSAILSSVGLHLSAFESDLSKEKVEELIKTRILLKDAHDKVRDLSHELVSPLLVKFGVQFALKDLCENNSNSIIQFDFQSNMQPDFRFETEYETKLYFIISEFLNNTIKHSKASECLVSLELFKKLLVITIIDNGIGFDVNKITSSDGFGITQIRARIKNINGDLKIKSIINQGTTITIKVNI